MFKFNKKILITLLLFLVFFVLNYSFAWDTSGNTTSSSAYTILQSINDFLKGIWLLFVILAWKLYTNDFIFWSSLHIDDLLWHIWQFSRTIANFTIWFILVVSIFLLFLWKVKNIVSIIWKVAIASVLINASWFIIWAVIDISTVLLVAVWSFPISLYWKLPTDATKQLVYCEKPKLWFEVSKDAHDPVKRFYTCEKKWTINNPDKFLEKMNNMTWPLFYIWASILNIDKHINIDIKEVKNWDSIWKSLTISFILQFIIIVLFVIPIILFVIIWVIRVFRLWIYIWFSPLIFLDQVFWWKAWKTHKAFLFRNMVWLVFQPVLVTFALWISLIFLTSLQTSFLKHWNNDEAKKALWICWNNSNSLCIDDNTKIVTIKWNFVNDIIKTAWWVFWYMILTILSIMILWSMIRLTFRSSEITSNISDSVYKFAWWAMKQIPFIPTPNGPVWIWAIQTALKKSYIIRWLEAKASEKSDKLTQKIFNALWIEQSDLTTWNATTRIKELDGAWTDYKKIYTVMEKFIEDTKRNTPNLVPMNAPQFQKVITSCIKKLWENHTDIYDKLLIKKDKINATNLFQSVNFQQFLTHLIKNPSVLNTQNDPGALIINATAKESNLLTKPIKDIN